MNWSINIHDKAIKSLAKIDRKEAAKIWHFLEVELPALPNPGLSDKAQKRVYGVIGLVIIA